MADTQGLRSLMKLQFSVPEIKILDIVFSSKLLPKVSGESPKVFFGEKIVLFAPFTTNTDTQIALCVSPALGATVTKVAPRQPLIDDRLEFSKHLVTLRQLFID